MTEISRPWTGRTSQGALGDAGAYSAAQWQQMYAHMIGNGAEKANRGVFRDVLEELEVVANSPADTTVIVEPGAAFVQGIFYLNDADKSVSIASNASGSTRIDIVVLEADYAAQTVRIDVVQGTPGAGIPALTQSAGSIWQIPLAYLTLASGYTSIPQTLITDWREYANIPSAIGIDVTNSSGVTLENGNVVIWLAAGGLAVDDTTAEGNVNVAGVIERRVLNGGAGRIIVQGVTAVICDELVAVGDILSTSTTSGQAQKTTIGKGFARVLTANTGAGTKCLAYVDPGLSGESPYDSGWFAVTTATTYTKAHGLSGTPRRIELYHAAVAAPGAGDEIVRVSVVRRTADYPGDLVGANATNVLATTGEVASGGTVYSTRRNSASGFYRILAWL